MLRYVSLRLSYSDKISCSETCHWCRTCQGLLSWPPHMMQYHHCEGWHGFHGFLHQDVSQLCCWDSCLWFLLLCNLNVARKCSVILLAKLFAITVSALVSKQIQLLSFTVEEVLCSFRFFSSFLSCIISIFHCSRRLVASPAGSTVPVLCSCSAPSHPLMWILLLQFLASLSESAFSPATHLTQRMNTSTRTVCRNFGCWSISDCTKLWCSYIVRL